MDTTAPKFMTRGTQVLIAITVAGGLAMLYRLAAGLGAATNLSDAHPWGIWIAFDDLSGIALAAGGYAMTSAYYIFGIKTYKAVVRPAILTAFLGYFVAAIGVVMDLGKPWAVWHPFVYPQFRSPMFAVAMGVGAVLTVLALEFAPVAAEGLKRESIRKKIDSWMVPLVIAGLVLSVVHQSSLGALFLVMKGRLSNLWYTPLLPVHFFVSSLAMGFAMVAFESIVAGRALNHGIDPAILRSLSRGAKFTLVVYLAIRLVDLVARGNLQLGADLASVMFLVELGAGVILPIVLYSMGSKTLWAHGLAVGGVVLNRFDVTFFSQAGSDISYFPSASELLITAGLVSFLLLAYRYLALRLPVLAHEPQPVGRA